MPTNSEELETLVRQIVIKAIGEHAMVEAEEVAETPGRLCLRNLRLVTLSDLESRFGPAGATEIREIAIDDRTVVTPAVHDHLRERNIKLIRNSQSSTATSSNPRGSEIAICDTGCPQRQQAFASQLGIRMGREIETTSCERAKIVLSDFPPSVVQRLCHAGSSAVQIGSLQEVHDARDQMPGSRWVLDMRRLGLIAATNCAVQLLK